MVHGIVIGLVLALVSLAPPAWAIDRTAASCNAADVQAALNAAVDGDRVIIPAGTCTWTGELVVSKAIEVTGSGSMPPIGAATSGGTTINIDGPSANASLAVHESSAGHIIISNIRFVVGSTATVPVFGVIVLDTNLVSGTPAQMAVVHHITMEYHQGTERSVRVATLHGLIYRSLFTNDLQPPNGQVGNTGPSIQCKGNSPLADNNWASPSTFGTADTNGDKNLYIETNTFTNHGTSSDIDDGCKAVIRFNTFIDATHNDHGHDTSHVGIRHYEIYNNTYQCVNDWNFTAWYGSRGGTGVVSDNIMPNQCYGRTVSRIAAQLQALRRKVFGLLPGDCYPGPYPWPRQHGWGWAGSGSMDNNVLEPIYVWNNKNTSGGTSGEADEYQRYDVTFAPPDGPCTFANTSQTTASYLQQNRDYYLGTAKPGYTKFTYPHPLATWTGSGVPATPTGLTVR